MRASMAGRRSRSRHSYRPAYMESASSGSTEDWARTQGLVPSPGARRHASLAPRLNGRGPIRCNRTAPAHHPLDGPGSLRLRAWQDAAFFDGPTQILATGDGGGEGALSRSGAATAHVRVYDAVAKRPAPVRPGAGRVA